METAEGTSGEKQVREAKESPRAPPAASAGGRAVQVDPDLDFINSLIAQGAGTLKKCIQCGTCSATCVISPDREPFPRQEMAWANWGMKDRLMADPGVWICSQCNDCSVRCPRGARPGDVLAAVRRESVLHYAFPRFMGRWVNQGKYVPFMLALPAALLCLALLLRDPIEVALGITKGAGEKIVYTYSHLFPHWLLNCFFGLFGLLALTAVLVGVRRFWRAMKKAAPTDRHGARGRALFPSLLTTLGSVFAHTNLSQCTRARSRDVAHICVFYGFLGLAIVSIWAITARVNPLIPEIFVYPFSLWSPWKMLANLGGIAILVGCVLMMKDRLKANPLAGVGNYFDWSLIISLVLVVFTGFVTEILHYARLEPHRHVAYFIHLVFAFAFLMYIPYSKLAHLAYRTTAMVFAEHTGLNEPLPAKKEPLSEGGDDEANEND